MTKSSVLNRLLIPLLLVAWVILSFAFLGLPVSTAILFILYLLLVIFVPGLTILSFTKHSFSGKDTIIFSFAIGYAVILLLYLILAMVNDLALYSKLLIVSSLLFLAVFLFLIIKKKIRFDYPATDVPVFLACAAAVTLTFVLLSMANLEPDLVGARPYYHDTLNGVGLTVSASRSFPMQSLQMSGWIFPYHLGYYIYTSSIMELLHTSAFEAVIKLSLIPVSPLCILSFASIMDLVKIKKKNLRNIILCILSFIPSFGLLHYLYMDTLGYPFGLFMCLASFIMFNTANSKDRRLNCLHVLSSLFLSAGMLSKGPLSVSFMFGTCFVLLLELIRKRNLWVIPKGLTYTIPFFLLYFVVYGNSAGDSMFYYPLFSAIQTPLAFALQGIFPEWLRRTICAVYYTSSLSWVLFISFLVVVSAVIRRKAEKIDIYAVSAVTIGYILLNTFKQEGSSELYFVSGVYPICFIAAAGHMEKWLLSLNKGKKAYAAGVIAVLLILALIPDAHFSADLFAGDDATEKSQATGLKSALTYSIINYRKNKHLDLSAVNGAVITEGQYEAFIWMKENLPESAVFSDYRYSSNNKFFGASIFSERSCFLEGWGYLTMEDKNNNKEEKIRRDTIVRFFNETKEESFCMLLKQEGVDYLVFEKAITGDWELSDKYVDEVFRNSDVIVYKIHSQ
ncbi:MAG: hypothetical protein IKG47_07685 [Oscillospiraceae bacterium]|nr:hypothetical protein [Oscillospiraceae bacterium]